MSERRFREYLASEPLLEAASLQLAIGQISELPAALTEQLSGTLRVAAIESFMVNIRLIGDFLLTNNDRDLRPEDFGVPWSRDKLTPEPNDAQAECEAHHTELRAQLSAYWDDASKLIVHFSKRRHGPLKERPMDCVAVSTMATVALIALAPFIRALIEGAPAGELDSELPEDSDNEAWARRALIERAQLLREEFVQGCGRLGLDGSRLLGLDECTVKDLNQ